MLIGAEGARPMPEISGSISGVAEINHSVFAKLLISVNSKVLRFFFLIVIKFTKTANIKKENLVSSKFSSSSLVKELFDFYIIVSLHNSLFRNNGRN
jgi:hypothetical protein